MDLRYTRPLASFLGLKVKIKKCKKKNCSENVLELQNSIIVVRGGSAAAYDSRGTTSKIFCKVTVEDSAGDQNRTGLISKIN